MNNSFQKSHLKVIVILLTLMFCNTNIYSQNKPDVVAGIPVNYDESLVGTYTLPDPLKFNNGKEVKSPGQWYKKRRPEIISLFEEFEYGKAPAAPKNIRFDVFDKGTPALDGRAIRKQVTVYLTGDTSDHRMDILIYLPAGTDKPVPLFFNVSFMPNETVTDDPGIKKGFTRGKDGSKVPVQRRGGFGRMNIDQFLSQGIGFATVYYGDIEPDFADGYKYGIRGHFLKAGQTYPAPGEW
jgi:hypothetical protein